MSHSALSVLPPRGPGGGGPPSYRHGNPRPRGGPFHSSHGHGHLAYQPYRLFPRTPSHHQHHNRSSNSSSATGSSPGGSSSNPASSAGATATGTPEKSGTSATGSTTENPNEYDGRRLRKSLVRKTVDYNAAIIRNIQNRVWQRDVRDRRGLQPDYSYAPDTVPPSALLDNPTNAVTTRYVKSATNKMRCPIFSMAWTPEGRRLVTGASSGEFTLWNGLTFNFETILQAHDSPVRSMVWSHNGVWMVTGDHAGFVKYWQSNMNNVKMFQAHKESVRCLTFSPTDQKFASCSDDGTVRIFDFMTCYEEKVLRGHGADVKCVDWHPHRGILVSGSKDNQQPIKIWDPKAGISLATLHAHKSTVMDARWNTHNGNWLATASRDHLIKLFDIRKLGQELQVFRGHKKEASCLAWHPIHENLFASGGSDGSILFWNVGCEKEVGSIESAHENIIWTLAWHPVGHILCSGSNDHTSKFWTRQKPGDIVRDRTHAFYDYNAGDDNEMEEVFIPGMGPEDKIHGSGDADEIEAPEPQPLLIPGLDTLAAEIHNDPSSRFYDKSHGSKKIPYQKPIPKKFVAIWNDACRPDEGELELEDEQGRMYPQPIFLNKPGGGGSGNPFDTGRSPIEPSVHNSQLPPSAISDFSNPFNPNIGFGPSGVDFGLGGPGGSGSGGQFWDQSGRDRERDRDRGRRRGGGGPGGRRGDRGGRWGNKR